LLQPNHIVGLNRLLNIKDYIYIISINYYSYHALYATYSLNFRM